MPVTLNASTSSGFAATADNSGVLTLQSNGTSAASVSGSNFQMDSGYGSVATAYGCRAWVNFNGTGTVAIRASGNVTSITDNGTGDYTVNFTTAMPDANYSAVALSQKGAQTDLIRCFNVITDVNVPTVNSIRLGHAFSSSTANDTAYAMVAIFR